MKQMAKMICVCAALLFMAIPSARADEAVFEIKEKMFVQQCLEIQFNVDDYLGKTVRLEGIYTGLKFSEDGDTTHYVFRKTPGCCGDDGAMAGFKVLLGSGVTAPSPNAWVEATGKVEKGGGYDAAVLRLSALKVMETRGAEVVRY